MKGTYELSMDRFHFHILNLLSLWNNHLHTLTFAIQISMQMINIFIRGVIYEFEMIIPYFDNVHGRFNGWVQKMLLAITFFAPCDTIIVNLNDLCFMTTFTWLVIKGRTCHYLLVVRDQSLSL